MKREPLVFVATSDFAGKVRGKAFPHAALDKRLKRGVGWTPTNVQITCFDAIAPTPFGALGDLLLVPDTATAVKFDFAEDTPAEHFMIGDILTLEGAPWECCTRSMLKAALQRLHKVSGLGLKGAFEHEFHVKGGRLLRGRGYGHGGFRDHLALGETLMGAINTAGLIADTFMKEYGADQYEVTVAPERGVRMADAAVILRELAYASAASLGHEVSFTPIRDPAGVGNGVHIHMSLVDADGAPASYDPDGKHGMAKVTGSFVAGVLKYLDSIVALTAPSVISYKRLTPHRWSAAFNNLGYRDREAAVRICPVAPVDSETIARQYNFEYRAADAAASPHLALAAILQAGAQGIEEALPTPEATHEDVSLLDPADLAARGLVRLPQSLPEALDRFAASPMNRQWFGDLFCDTYLAHKRGEMAYLEGKDDATVVAAYEEVY